MNRADHAAARGNSKMLHQGARIPVRGNNRQLTIGRGDCEGGHAARHGLDDVVKHHLSNGGETLHSSFPPTVEVYHEISMQRTIVEVQARDQIGLLYRLAKAIFDFGFDITFARIGTERGVAIDTFYIESANHEPVEDAD